MMVGSYNNLVACLELTDELVPMLEEAMKVRAPGYMFSPAYQNYRKFHDLLKKGVSVQEARRLVGNKMWDGWITFYSKRKSGFFFPTGFLYSKKFYGVRHRLIDAREGSPDYGEPKVYGIQLRDYQLEATYECLKKQRGIVAAATNSGKTEIAAAVISAIRKPTLFLTHRSNLAIQTRDRLKERLGLNEVNLFGTGGKDFGPITVATVQSIYSLLRRRMRPPELDLFQVVFADEAHHYSSDAFRAVLKQLPKAFWRFGLTGTPHKDETDPKWWYFVAYTGGILFEIRNEQLIDLGVSAPVKITFYKFKHDPGQRFTNWHNVFRELIEDSIERNLLLAELVKNSPPGVFIAIKTIRQGENLVKLLPGAVLLTGNESVEFRAKELERFAKGEIKIILATSWFHEGMDVPEIKTLVNASGGLSGIELLQKLGRGLRKKSDGSMLVYIDVYDSGNKYLEKHSEERCNVLREDGHEVEITEYVPEKQERLF